MIEGIQQDHAMTAAPTMTAAAATATSSPRPKTDAAPLPAPPVAEALAEVPDDVPVEPEGACERCEKSVQCTTLRTADTASPVMVHQVLTGGAELRELAEVAQA